MLKIYIVSGWGLVRLPILDYLNWFSFISLYVYIFNIKLLLISFSWPNIWNISEVFLVVIIVGRKTLEPNVDIQTMSSVAVWLQYKSRVMSMLNLAMTLHQLLVSMIILGLKLHEFMILPERNSIEFQILSTINLST